MTGREIFLTITAFPDRDAATSFVLKAFDSKTRRIDSATAALSMMAPSTMLSGGTGSLAKAATRKPLPAAFNSTALTALEPMSSPTTDRLFLNKEKFFIVSAPRWARPVPACPRIDYKNGGESCAVTPCSAVLGIGRRMANLHG